MAEEFSDRNDPELKYLSVERSQFNDPATQAEWTQKRLVWVPHDNQVRKEPEHSSIAVKLTNTSSRPLRVYE